MLVMAWHRTVQHTWYCSQWGQYATADRRRHGRLWNGSYRTAMQIKITYDSRTHRNVLPPDHAEVALLRRVPRLSEHEETCPHSIVAENLASQLLRRFSCSSSART